MNAKRYMYFGLIIEVPEMCNWIATDENGGCSVFRDKPIMLSNGMWVTTDDFFAEYLYHIPPPLEWDKTLRHISELEEVA